MNRKWIWFAGFGVISCAVFITLNRKQNHKYWPLPSSETLLKPTRRVVHERSGCEPDSLIKITSARTKETGLRKDAIRLLRELDDSDGYQQVLLQARLSSIFREWGKLNISEAERFLNEEDAARGLSHGHRQYRDELIFAAWIGLADIDPMDAWARFVKAWTEDDRVLIIHPSLLPLSHESAARDLFDAYFASAPEAALDWLRTSDPAFDGIVTTTALQAVMASTREREERLRLFTELCANPSAEYGLASVCAGIAEQDPEQAWELIHKGRSRTDGPLTSESPEIIASEMIQRWSIKQPEQALEFILSREPDDFRGWLLEPFFMTQLPRRPDLVIQALQHEALASIRDRFSATVMMTALTHTNVSWPLVDDHLPLAPDERVRVMTQAVRVSSLPASLKDSLLRELTHYP